MAGEAVATAVVKEGVGSCFDMVGRYISYTRKYKKNINILQVELKKIVDTKYAILRKVEIAENNAENIRRDVRGWLQTCEHLSNQASELLPNLNSFNMSCLCCSCPNLKSRYLSSTEAAELTSSITKHLGEVKGNLFDQVGQEALLGQSPLLSPGEYHGFESRTIKKEEVMDDLKNDSITVIGLIGMGGVGKTTLVKKIAEEVKNEKLFDEVAFVVVSQNANVKEIQEKLASRLGLKDIEKKVDDQGRAELLYNRLMDEKKKILVILDDIWEELNLRSIGIPVHGDRKGFKILMTSQNDRVYTDMEVQKRLLIAILSKDEAWNLFKITAQISDEAIHEIAKEVSQECAGLPRKIVNVGKCLRGKKEDSFRDVLQTLRDPSSSNNTSGVLGVLEFVQSSFNNSSFISSSSSRKKQRHEIFISFRGETRNSFVSHLQNALEKKQAIIFSDKTSLHNEGEHYTHHQNNNEQRRVENEVKENKDTTQEQPPNNVTYWIEARKLSIAWGDDQGYWTWISLPTYKSEVAQLHNVYWLDIQVKISTKLLLPKTSYMAYLIFKVEAVYEGLDKVQCSVTYTNEIADRSEGFTLYITKKKVNGEEGVWPQPRPNDTSGLMELKLGMFFNNVGEDGDVTIRLFETSNIRKAGLTVVGIELRTH